MPISAITIKTLEPQPIVAIRTKTGDVGKTLSELLPELWSFIVQHASRPAGMPLAIWYGCADGIFDMDAAIPVGAAMDGEGRIHAGQLPGGKAATVIYSGHYNGITRAWNEFMQAMSDEGLEGTGDPWEIYLTDPEAEPDPQKWQTELVYPLKS